MVKFLLKVNFMVKYYNNKLENIYNNLLAYRNYFERIVFPNGKLPDSFIRQIAICVFSHMKLKPPKRPLRVRRGEDNPTPLLITSKEIVLLGKIIGRGAVYISIRGQKRKETSNKESFEEDTEVFTIVQEGLLVDRNGQVYPVAEKRTVQDTDSNNRSDPNVLRSLKNSRHHGSRYLHLEWTEPCVYTGRRRSFGEGPLSKEWSIGPLASGNLKEYLRKNPSLPLKDKIRFVKQLFSALEAIFKKGIIHKDISLENILVFTKDGSEILKLTDWDTAVFLTDEKRRKNLAGRGEYMPPALFRAADPNYLNYTIGTDTFALGEVLKFIFFGSLQEFRKALDSSHPFHEIAQSIEGIDWKKITTLEDFVNFRRNFFLAAAAKTG